MTYLDNLVIHFDKIYETDCGGKIRIAIDAYVCSNKVMFPA